MKQESPGFSRGECQGIGTFGCDDDGYLVDDVDYCIEQANDMVAGIGDFAVDGPQPNQVVDVTELDRSAYPATL